MTMNKFTASGATGIYQVFTANGFADARIGEIFTCSVWMATEVGGSTQGGISNITVESKVAGHFLWWGYQLERGSTMTAYTKRS